MQPLSLLLGLGVLAGLLLVIWRAPQKETSRYLDAGLAILLGALLGSRIVSVAVNWGYYQVHPVEIVQVWLGGLSGVGALAGGVLAILILSFWWKGSIGSLADTYLPLAGTMTTTAWLGCWVDRCSYGLASGAWWSLPSRDEWGVLADRLPVQLAGAVVTLVFIWLLERVSRRSSIPGMTAAIGLFGVSAEIFALSFWRADPALTWRGIRLEAWGAVIMMILSMLIVVVLFIRWIARRGLRPLGKYPVQGR